MRKNVLPITAGVVGALVLSVSASADFTGWVMEKNPEPFDTKGHIGPDVGLVDVWNLYLVFDNPLDTLNAIFAIQDPAFNTIIHSSDLKTPFDGAGDGFWNWNFGLNRPVRGPVFSLDNNAANADTFMTIGLKAALLDVPIDAAGFATGAEALLNDSGIMNGTATLTTIPGEPPTNFAYFATPKDLQTFPGEDGRLLVFQVAVRAGQHASGVWNVQWGTVAPGAGGETLTRFEWTTVPAPGAMALLGLAGLAGARRRRRR